MIGFQMFKYKMFRCKCGGDCLECIHQCFKKLTKICDTIMVTGNKYLHRFGLAKWPWAKLNNNIHSVYICPAVCIVCCKTIWP